MSTLDDLKRIIGSGHGNVIAIENLTINVNDYSQHAEIHATPALPPARLLYPWWTFDKASCDRVDQAMRDRWENDHELTGYW